MASLASRHDLDFFNARAAAYSAEYPATREWRQSPFGWMLTLAPGTRGALARRMVEEWASSLNLPAYQETEHGQRYVVVNSRRIQVKLSTLWQSGEYRFQQIRDQSYDYLLCLGLSPDDIHAWLIPKVELLSHLRGTAGQHTGAAADETFWIATAPSGGAPWLSEYGNQLSDVRGALQQL